MRIVFAAVVALLTAVLSSAVGSAAPSPYQQYVGLYKFSDGETVFIGRIDEVNGLVSVNFGSSRLRTFRQQTPGVFVSGPTLGTGDPIEVTARFQGDVLNWQEAGANRPAQRVAFKSEEVRFRSGELTLAGTLLLPAGKSPYRAVVLGHGGGGADRNFFFVPEFFAMHGIAVLAYDKRGVGQSTGDWQRASHRDLATDLVAGIDYLRTRTDIDKAKIGLYGSSEGGWTAPIAYTIAGAKVSWLIVRSASGLTNRENRLYEVEGNLRDHGFGDDAVAAALALHRRDAEVIEHNGEGWNEFRAELERASTQPWFQFARLPARIIEYNEQNKPQIIAFMAEARRHWGEEPARIWEQVKCPVLMQIGEIDRNVPAAISVKVIGAALQRAGNDNVTIKVYPRGDHGIFESTRGYQSDIRGVTRLVPGYLQDLGDWIDAHAK